MIRRPVLATTAAASALLLCAAPSAGAAATAATPAAGSASSNLALLSVTAGGHALSVGNLALSSSTLTGTAVGKAVITPLLVDGTAYGQQTVTPSSSPVTVPGQSSPAALSQLLSVASPAFSASATDAPSSHAGTSSLGSFSILGLTVPLHGAVDLGSAVSTVDGAVGQKTVIIKDLKLPSVADLLAALGLDLSKLPVGTLTALTDQLGLATSAVNTARTAVDSAQAAVTTATATLGTKAAGLTSATAAQSAAQTALTSATTALQSVIAQIPLASLPVGAGTVAGFTALPPATQSTLVALVPTSGPAALAGFDAAKTALATATTAVTIAQAAVNAAQAALAALQATLTAAISTVLGLVTGILDSTPLVSLDTLNITSRAVAVTSKPGGQHAEVVGGTVSGLKVLGTDVLDSALGTSSVNLLDLVGTTAGTVNSTISNLTGTLSSVLSNVPSLPKLSIPAPQVALLTKSAKTGISGGFGTADTAVQGLRITIPAITLPTSVALPGAASLPALSGVSQVTGLLSSAPVSVGLATLSDQAAFKPAVVPGTTPNATPGTVTPTLPRTGLPVGIAILSLALIGGAVVLRRRSAHEG